MRRIRFVFEPDQIEDNATYAAPLNPPSGITFVFVNGVLALHPGKTTDKNAGRLIDAGRGVCGTAQIPRGRYGKLRLHTAPARAGGSLFLARAWGDARRGI
jgi:hypothetical protein